MDRAAGKLLPTRDVPRVKLTCDNRKASTEKRHEREASNKELQSRAFALHHFRLFRGRGVDVRGTQYTLSISGRRPESKSLAMDFFLYLYFHVYKPLLDAVLSFAFDT